MKLLWLLAVIVLYRGNAVKGAEEAKPTSEPEVLEAQPILLKELVGAAEELTAPLVKRTFQGGDVAATSENGEKDKPKVKPQILPIEVGESNGEQPSGEPDVIRALPLVFKALVGANEDLIAPLIKKAFQGGDVAATSETGEKGKNTGVVGKPRPQVRPQIQPIRPIAVGEPNGQQPPVDYSLDGYFYKGAKKVASYRIDFRGVHFSVKKEKNEIDELIGELIGSVDPELPQKEEKEEKEEKDEEKEKEKKEQKEMANTPAVLEPAPEKAEITPAAPIAGGGDSATEQHEINTRKAVEPTSKGPFDITDAPAYANTKDVRHVPDDPQTTPAAPVAGGNSNIVTEEHAADTRKAVEPTSKGPFDITEAPVSGNDSKTTLIVEPGEEVKTTPAAPGGDIVTDPHGNIIVEVEPTTGKGPLAPRPSGNDRKSTMEVEEPVKKETTPAAPVAGGGGATPIKTDAPAAGNESKTTEIVDPVEKVETTPSAPVEDAGKSTVAVEEPAATKEKRDNEKPTPSAPIAVGDIVYTDGLPQKPAFDKDANKCHEYLAYTFNEKAGRCLANKTSVCKEEDWEAFKKKTFRECMRSAPKDVLPTDGKNTSDCGFGKVYAQVPGEPSALLYGRRCNENFCPKEGTCVQEQYSAHCCILQRWEHFG